MGSRRFLPLLMALIITGTTTQYVASAPADAQALLAFKATLSDPTGSLTNWDPGTPPCKKTTESNWNGVLCDTLGVYGLKLDNMTLNGTLNFDSLSAMPDLRIISLMGNNFTGSMPSLAPVRGLRALFLSENDLSGTIPEDAFQDMVWLKKVYLSQNHFSGPIPLSLAELPRLVELELDNNEFEGHVPEFRQIQLRIVDVSNNKLKGRVPECFSKSQIQIVAGGNKGLCGESISVDCTGFFPEDFLNIPAQPRAGPTIAIFLALFIAVIVAVAVFNTKPRNAVLLDSEPPGHGPGPAKPAKYISVDTHPTAKIDVGKGGSKAAAAAAAAAAAKENETPKLVFVRHDRGRFELQDLLKTSAEVLGTGSLGCSFKTCQPNGKSMVVKRYRDMNRGSKEEFDEHMRRMGRMSHPNLMPIVAYNYKKEEKLLVTDYAENRSLVHVLHGKRGVKSVVLDWPKRLNIIKGVAKGLCHLYEELQMLTVPHGHLKASNVLLNESFEPLLVDYAFLPVMNQDHAAQSMVSYKCPERRLQGRTSKKSDVWCLGIIILETLTGKVPTTEVQQGKESIDIENYVRQFVRDGKAREVLDPELEPMEAYENDMIEMLEIGLACCEEALDKRLSIEHALKRIEAVKGVEELPLIAI